MMTITSSDLYQVKREMGGEPEAGSVPESSESTSSVTISSLCCFPHDDDCALHAFFPLLHLILWCLVSIGVYWCALIASLTPHIQPKHRHHPYHISPSTLPVVVIT